jgi:alpha-beta hydrolase superfamily lysophospholipase
MKSPMAPDTLEVTASDGLRLAAYRWVPPTHPRGIVQISHGLGEHLRRYAPLAEALTAEGFIVQGHDHRGHGASLPEGAVPGEIGAAGWGQLVGDIGQLLAHARAEHPGLPVVLLGHSVGSYAVQQYLLDASDQVDAAVLSGTALLDLTEPFVDLDAAPSLAPLNAPFEPARTEADWLSRDEAQVDAYLADPLCGFAFDIDATRAMFVGARALADPARLGRMRSDLPIYVVAGDADPVNGQLALVHALVERYRGAGLEDVTLRVYEGARHEVFNETNRNEVVADLIAWLDRVVPAPGH